MTKLEDQVKFLNNFIQLLAVKDKTLGDQLNRQKSENIRHSKASKHTIKKVVDAGAGYEERLGRVERQISTLFDAAHRLEELLKSKQTKTILTSSGV